MCIRDSGNFKQINNISVNNIARLNKDGSLDLTFDSGNGPDGAVHSLSIDNHGILIGGIFVTYDGVSSRRIARLSLDGSINDNFDVRLGFDGPVQSIYKRLDGRYLIGGSFGYYNGVIQNNISLVNIDGSIEENELLTLGLNGTVYSISEFAGGNSVFGGSFSKDNKESGYNGFALLNQISSIKPPRLKLIVNKGGFDLSIDGSAGEAYYLEYSKNLNDWSGMTKVVIPENGIAIIELGSPVDSRYFRVLYME